MQNSFVPLETVGGLHRGPLCPYVEAYVALVAQQGYKPKVELAQVRLIAALNCLLVRTRRDARDVEPELTARFLRRRLRGREACGSEWSTLDRLTALLRQSGVTAQAERASASTQCQGGGYVSRIPPEGKRALAPHCNRLSPVGRPIPVVAFCAGPDIGAAAHGP